MPRIALYAHDTYGLGHLRRCLKLAAQLAGRLDDVEGLIVTGSPWHRLFPPPAGFRICPLPPVVKTGVGRYESRVPGCDLATVLAERRRVLEEAVDDFRPHLLLVDNVPCGLHGEVLPLLRRQGGRSVLVLRDVLDRPDTVRDEWAAAGAGEALEGLFEEIWIFGEEPDADALRAPGLLGDVADRLRVCGRLAAPPNGSAGPRSHGSQGPRRVLVTGGGGRDAEPLVRTYLEALATFRPPTASRVVLGPDFPEVTRVTPSAARSAVRVDRFVPDLGAVMEQADVVVAMAGYNTVCEILESGCPAVLVPRRYPRDEQWLRATRWRRQGRVEVLDPRDLTPEALWRAVETALGSERHAPDHGPGGRRAARLAQQLLDRAVLEVGA